MWTMSLDQEEAWLHLQVTKSVRRQVSTGKGHMFHQYSKLYLSSECIVHNEIIYLDASKPICLCVDNHTFVVFCVNGVYWVSTLCGSGSVLIALSEPQGCRSRCCQRSL